MAPPVTSGLRAHYDAQALTGLANNDDVASFTDESGNGHHLATVHASGGIYLSAGGPNSLPAVSFPATRALEGAVGATMEHPLHVFVVASLPTAGLVDHISGGGSSTPAALLRRQSDAWGWYNGVFLYENVTTDDAWHLFGLLGKGATSVLRRDRAVRATGSSSTRNLNNVSLGARPGGGSSGDVIVAEYLLYSRELNSTEVDQVEAYLHDKWIAPATGTELTGTSESVTDGQGTVSVSGALSGTSESVTAGDGALSVTTTPLAGTSETVSEGQGELSVTLAGTALTGTSETVSDGDGALTATTSLDGTSQTVTEGSGALTVSTALSGTSETVAEGSGSIDQFTALEGTSETVTEGNGSLSVTTTPLSGTSTTETDGDGIISVSAALSGTSETVTYGSGNATFVVVLDEPPTGMVTQDIRRMSLIMPVPVLNDRGLPS